MNKNEEQFEEDVEERPKPKWQKLFNIPFVGDTLTILVAGLPPYFAQMAVNNWFFISDDSTYFTFSLCLVIWNLFLWIFFDLLLTVPVIPIPWFVLGIIHLFYQTGVIIWNFFNKT